MIKNKILWLTFAGLFLCSAMPAMAQEKNRDEKNLDKAAADVEKDAGKPETSAAVTDKLKTQFNVDDARIQGLRDQKLGYGEVSIVLSLAQNMPGGITDENVQKVMALRQGPPVMGWGKVAKELGLKLGTVVSKVKKVSAEARKQAAADKKKAGMEKAEKGGKPEKQERPAKSERPEKGGRPETPKRK